jgi:hypothetical protein
VGQTVAVATAAGVQPDPPAPALKRDPLVDSAVDPFTPISFLPPPPAPTPVDRSVATVVVPPPPAPVAPPFPFRYLGRMTGIDGTTGVYIASDQELLQVRAGQLVAGGFRVDAIDDKQIALTYVPLDEHLIVATPTAAH